MIRKARKERDAATLEQQALGTTYQQAKEGETIAKPLQVLSPRTPQTVTGPPNWSCWSWLDWWGDWLLVVHSLPGARIAEP